MELKSISDEAAARSIRTARNRAVYATPGVTDSLPTFNKVMGPLLRTPEDGADTAVWLVATRPESAGSKHFWHDRALRPTTFGWQRADDPAATRRFLAYVTGATDTTAAW